MKNFALALAAVVALLACSTGAEARSPWKIQQRYQKNYQRDVRHPATTRPMQNYRQRPHYFQGLQLDLGRFNLRIGRPSPRVCPPRPFFHYHR